MSAPDEYVAWINEHLGFNPRSQTNSNALSDFVTADLLKLCPSLTKAISSKVIVSAKNADVQTRVAVRNVDLVFAEKEMGPGAVRAAVENKTIMAAHGKARWNRYGDLIAYCNHVHNHRDACIAAAIVVVNCSPMYENPDSFAKGLQRPRRDMKKVVSDTLKIFADIPLRSLITEPNDQPEALALVTIDYDGTNPAKLVTGELASQPGTATHYDSFIGRICDLYNARFGE